MPSPRVEEILSTLTEQEYHTHRERFERIQPEAAVMSFDEFMEQLALRDQLLDVSLSDEGRDHKADCASNGLGCLDYMGSRMPCSRKARDHHASGSSHGHGDRRGLGRRDYEAYYGDESLGGEFRGLRAGGSGNPGARIQSGAFNPYGPAHRNTGCPTDDPADFGGRDYGHRASPPPRRGGMSLGEHSLHSLMLALVITEAGKTLARRIAMMDIVGMIDLGARVVATADDAILQAVAVSRT